MIINDFHKKKAFGYLVSKEQLLTTYYSIIQAWYRHINELDETVKTA